MASNQPAERGVERDAAQYQVARELLQTAVMEARGGAVSLIFANSVIAWLGWSHGHPVAAAVVVGLSGIIAVWRVFLARRVGSGDLTPETVARSEREFEANCLLLSLMSVITAAIIYPAAPALDAVLIIAALCAMLAVAPMFISLVGRAFQLYVAPQLLALFAVSLFDPRTYSPLFAISIPVFYLTLRHAAQLHRSATELAIRRRIETDAANAAKTQFLANMSHEIRTPMNGVIGALDLLGRGELSAPQRKLLETATSSSEALLTVLNEVLDFAKIEAGKLELLQEPLFIRAVLVSVVNLFSPLAQHKGLALSADLDPTLPARVRGDAARIRQVLLNLVGNAIKFTDRGSITVRARRAPGGGDSRLMVVFEVEDTGIGIASDVAPSLFTAFFQADQSDQRRFGGTGLGLVISKRLAEAMGGELSVDSTLGRGSVFRLSLPLEALPDLPEPQAPAPSAAQPSAKLSGKVLLVEDNPVNRTLAGAMLRSLGLEVVEAEDGKIALQQMERSAFDLVLMDCQMPVMDGFAATREIRGRATPDSHTPIIAVTANAMSGDAERCLQAGMDAHLAKPFTLDQLRAAITPWLWGTRKNARPNKP